MSTDDLWIIIPNWEKFQHYKDRNPTWIKLYLELANRDEWLQLSLAERGLLCSIWVEYALGKGLLRHRSVTSRIGATARQRHLDSLQAAGFIQLSASKPVPIRYQPSSLDKEEDKEKELALRSKKGKPQNVRAAEAWIRNGLAHHIPDDQLATVIQDEFRIDNPAALKELVAQARNGGTPHGDIP